MRLGSWEVNATTMEALLLWSIASPRVRRLRRSYAAIPPRTFSVKSMAERHVVMVVWFVWWRDKLTWTCIGSSVISGSCTCAMVRTRLSTFLNVDDTISQDQQFVQFFPVFAPFYSLMHVNEDDGTWWLLDSCYCHENLCKARREETYDCSCIVQLMGQRSTCMDRRMCMGSVADWRTDHVKHRRARLRALVADIRSNIIITTTLLRVGNLFRTKTF